MSLGENFTHGVVEAFGYKIPYIEAGEGEVLISLPGSAGLELSTAKDALAKSYRVIELDPPGWGETTPLEGRMRQRDVAIVLAAAIQEMGIDSYHLLGTSMGGTNAYWLASQYPDRIKSIILEAPMLFTGPDELIDPSALQMIEALVGGMPIPDMSGYPAPPPHPNKPWADEAFFREQMRRRFVMMAKSDHSYDAPELRAFAQASEIPTLLLFGTEEEILNQGYPEHFKSLVRGVKVSILEGGIHDLQNSVPDAFVAEVKAHIG